MSRVRILFPAPEVNMASLDIKSKGRVYTVLVDDDILEELKDWTITIAHRKGKQYVQIRQEGETGYLHRYITEAPDGVMVDHRNENSLDNQRHNLRLANNSINQLNKSKANSNNNSTGIQNIYTVDNSFRVVVQGKDYGRFPTLGIAITERDRVRREQQSVTLTSSETA